MLADDLKPKTELYDHLDLKKIRLNYYFYLQEYLILWPVSVSASPCKMQNVLSLFFQIKPAFTFFFLDFLLKTTVDSTNQSSCSCFLLP